MISGCVWVIKGIFFFNTSSFAFIWSIIGFVSSTLNGGITSFFSSSFIESFFKRELGVGVLGSNTSKKYYFANSYDGLKYKKSYLYYISIEVLGNKFGDSPWISNHISKKEQEQTGEFGGFGGGSFGGGGAEGSFGYN